MQRQGGLTREAWGVIVAVGATPGPTSGRGRERRPLLSPFGGPPLRRGLGAAQKSREHICLPPVCSWGPHGPHQPETARPTGDLSYSWFGGALPSRPHPPLHTQPPLCTLPFNPECTHTHTHSKVSESQGLDSLKGRGRLLGGLLTCLCLSFLTCDPRMCDVGVRLC